MVVSKHRVLQVALNFADDGTQWNWVSMTADLAADGDLVISFKMEANAGSWACLDDVHLYCTELDGTSYTMTLDNITGNRVITNTGNQAVVTCDIKASNPNAILRSSGGGNITTAAGASMNNLMYKSSSNCYIDKMVLYDGYSFTDYVDDANYFCNDATLYRSIPADTWCSLVIPFWPTTTLTKKYPSKFNTETGVLTFADVTTASCWNDEPMLIKSSSALTAITGKRAGTSAGASGITYGDMTSGAGVPMTGVYTSGSVPQSTETIYYYALGTDNNLHKVTGGSVTINPFRAYFTLDNSAGGDVKGNVIRLNFDDTETGIGSVKSEEMKAKSYYNLAGQRVTAPRKGLYIVDGRKVVIR